MVAFISFRVRLREGHPRTATICSLMFLTNERWEPLTLDSARRPPTAHGIDLRNPMVSWCDLMQSPVGRLQSQLGRLKSQKSEVRSRACVERMSQECVTLSRRAELRYMQQSLTDLRYRDTISCGRWHLRLAHKGLGLQACRAESAWLISKQ